MSRARVTLEQFREAMFIVENYCDQINQTESISAKSIGCVVVLSKWGRDSLKEYAKPHNKQGVVVDWLDWHSTQTCEDGLVTVKWNGVSKPQTMHISQVTPIKLKP